MVIPATAVWFSPMLHNYFSFVFTFPNIALKLVLRACEVVWGCSVPWEHLSLDFNGQLIFVSKADPLNGEVFC